MKPQYMIDNDEWGLLCERTNGLINDLCLHEISKNEFYFRLKEEIETYRKRINIPL